MHSGIVDSMSEPYAGSPASHQQQSQRMDQVPADGTTEFTVRWDHHDSRVCETMTRAWEKRLFLDVTLASGNQTIGAHRLVLSAGSSLLEEMLSSPAAQQHPHPMLFFNEIDFVDLTSLVEFMYRGTMTVTRQTLPGIINAAQMLKVRGLTRDMDEPIDSPPDSSGGSESKQPSRKRRKQAVDDPSPLGKHEAESEAEPENVDAMSPKSAGAPGAFLPPILDPEQQKQVAAAFLSLMAQQQTPQTKSKLVKHDATPNGPSPGLRSRLVWDPAHIAYLERWYTTETPYPTPAISQIYANTLAQVPPMDKSGKSRDSSAVTGKNVLHWFQNRRRKDKMQPENEEKKAKRGQKRTSKGSAYTPLDLTQQQTTQPTTPHQVTAESPTMDHERDSDYENGLCIDGAHQSDADNDPTGQ